MPSSISARLWVHYFSASLAGALGTSGKDTFLAIPMFSSWDGLIFVFPHTCIARSFSSPEWASAWLCSQLLALAATSYSLLAWNQCDTHIYLVVPIGKRASPLGLACHCPGCKIFVEIFVLIRLDLQLFPRKRRSRQDFKNLRTGYSSIFINQQGILFFMYHSDEWIPTIRFSLFTRRCWQTWLFFAGLCHTGVARDATLSHPENALYWLLRFSRI